MLQASVPKAVCVAVVGALLLQSLASAPAECNQAVDPQCQGQDDGMTSLLQTVPAKAEKQKLKQSPMSGSQSASPITQSNQHDPASLAGSRASVEAAMSSHQTYDKVVLAKQRASSCFMDAATRDTFMMNPLDPMEDCYMNLNPLKEPGAMADGSSYRLQLTWDLDDYSTVDVVWTQTSSPLESTITGFNAISADAINAHEYSSGATCAKFDGLGKSPEGACVLDGNGNGDCFFNCAGTVVQWNGEDFIPGPMGRKARTFVLWLLKLPQEENYHYQLLARQVPSDCYMNVFARRAWKQSSYDPDASCYMNLDPLMESGAKADGSSYRFELKWTLDDDSIVNAVWTQTSLPMDTTITGFQAINAFAVDANGYTGGATCAKFEGLGKSSDGLCVLDGNGDGDCFFNCVGTLGRWNQEDFIPGPMERKAKKVELHLLMSKTFSYKKLAQQTTTDCHMDVSTKDSISMWTNGHLPDASCYMNLQPLFEETAKADGYFFHFRLDWEFTVGHFTTEWDDEVYPVLRHAQVFWRQTSLLWEPTITGFKAINANAMAAYDHPADNANFRGLGKSADSQCMLDGNGAGPGFWNCMGLTVASSSIPGPMSRQASAAKLHLMIPGPGEPGERFNYELLARHVPQQCHFDSSVKDYNLFNSHDPQAACYMDTTPLIGNDAKIDYVSTYRLMLKWKLDDGVDFDVIWEQWTDPRTNEYPSGYKAINVNAMALGSDYVDDCTKFRGLALSANAQCVFDGTGSSDQCYWNCVGLIQMWENGFIPGPAGRKARRVELWLINKRNIVE